MFDIHRSLSGGLPRERFRPVAASRHTRTEVPAFGRKDAGAGHEVGASTGGVQVPLGSEQIVRRNEETRQRAHEVGFGVFDVAVLLSSGTSMISKRPKASGAGTASTISRSASCRSI